MCTAFASEAIHGRAKISPICVLPRSEIHGNAHKPEYYPEINLGCDGFNTSNPLSRHTASGSVLLPVEESLLKRIVHIYFEYGFKEALNEATTDETAACSPTIFAIARFTFNVMAFVRYLKSKICSYLKEPDINTLANHVETRDWLRACIRFIAWHPNCFKIAVAGRDDCIRIYSDEVSIVPVLKDNSQKRIACMAWRPYCVAELAVGCEKGICLWTISSKKHITRSQSLMVFLKHKKHYPVISVQWDADGNILASASIRDTDILLWHIDSMQSTPLKRIWAASSLLKWSPDGSCLFNATLGNVFRLWYTENKWRPECCRLPKGYIQSACWSPCSRFLLFVTSEEPMLYRLDFVDVFIASSSQKGVVPMADLTQTSVGEHHLGGRPQALAWDPNGLYLAITFRDTDCIALFSTCLQKDELTLSPLKFLSGVGNDYPAHICFQSKNFKNSNSVLTIGWSGGWVQFVLLVNM
uniref:Aladin seven-bladed propeller domain-containing protein n=1 Tax=Glossina austeni TaxID=7395 RepID=A0A1A9V9E0_GLOAU